MAYKMSLSKWKSLDECLKRRGVTYSFPSGRNDGFIYETGNEDGAAKFHIHSIERVDEDDMIFEKLLTKSSNWRGGAEPDLAAFPFSDWEEECSGMDSSVVIAVKALADCFKELGATRF